MILRYFALAVALAAGLVTSQLPEFSQQYRQRLGGAIDELSRILADFDAAVQAREAILARVEALPNPEVRSAVVEARLEWAALPSLSGVQGHEFAERFSALCSRKIAAAGRAERFAAVGGTETDENGLWWNSRYSETAWIGATPWSWKATGLVAAMVLCGSQLVTATLWSLPTTAGYRRFTSSIGDPMADVVIAVDAAHQADDAALAVNRWQRAQMRRWRAGDTGASPLYWAALATFSVDGAR